MSNTKTTTTDADVRAFLLTRVSAAVRNSGAPLYIANKMNGIAILYSLPERTDEAQAKRVLATLTAAELTQAVQS